MKYNEKKCSETDLYNRIAHWMVTYHPFWSNIVGETESSYLHDCRAFHWSELIDDIKNCLEIDQPKLHRYDWKKWVEELYEYEDLEPQDMKKPLEEVIKSHLSKEAREEAEELIQDVEDTENALYWDEEE